MGLPRIGVRWLILAVILIASGISYVLRTNISVIGESMIKDLGLTEIQLGMVFSAFAAGYALFQFPGGLFGDKLGARKALVIIAIVWGFLTIFTGLVPSADSASVVTILVFLIVTRFLVGAAHAPLFPVASGRTISRWFPVGHWGLPNGLISTGLTLGAAATAPLLVWLVSAYGWRWSLFLTAPLAFILALVWWFAVRDDPKDHPLVSSSELKLITAGRSFDTDENTSRAGWAFVLKNRDILLLALSYFCMNYVFFLFFNWFFFYLVDVKEFNSEEAGILMAALWIIGAIGATLGGFVCDWLNRRYGLRWGAASLAATGLTLCAVFLVLGATSGAPYIAVIFLSLCFGCNQITEASYWATAIAVSGDRAAEGCGVMNTGGNIVGLVGGVFVPFVAAGFGWTIAMCTGAVFALVGAVTWLFIRGDRTIERPDTPREISSHGAPKHSPPVS